LSQGKNVTVDVSSGSKCHGRLNTGGRNVKASHFAALGNHRLFIMKLNDFKICYISRFALGALTLAWCAFTYTHFIGEDLFFEIL
jgi:hypothetical protein